MQIVRNPIRFMYQDATFISVLQHFAICLAQRHDHKAINNIQRDGARYKATQVEGPRAEHGRDRLARLNKRPNHSSI